MRYAIHVPTKDLANRVRHTSDGRRYATMQKVADAVTPDMLNGDPVYIHDTDESGYFKWFRVKAMRAMAGMETESLDASPFEHPPVANAYYVHADAAWSVPGRNGVSFHVMYGDPWDAVGARQDEFNTLKEAVAYMRHHAGDGPVFRVRLERFDGEHSVKEIKS